MNSSCHQIPRPISHALEPKSAVRAVPARLQVKCTDPCSDMPQLRMLFTVPGTFWVGARKLKLHAFVFAVIVYIYMHLLFIYIYMYLVTSSYLYTCLFVLCYWYYVQTCPSFSNLSGQLTRSTKESKTNI